MSENAFDGKSRDLLGRAGRTVLEEGRRMLLERLAVVTRAEAYRRGALPGQDEEGLLDEWPAWATAVDEQGECPSRRAAYRGARSLGLSHDDAEDVAGTVMAEALAVARASDHRELRHGYFYKAGKDRAVDHLRREALLRPSARKRKTGAGGSAPRVSLPDREGVVQRPWPEAAGRKRPPTNPATHDGTDARMRMQRLRHEFSALPTRQGWAVLLSETEQWTDQEISTLFGLSRMAVKSLLARGRRALKAFGGLRE